MKKKPTKVYVEYWVGYALTTGTFCWHCVPERVNEYIKVVPSTSKCDKCKKE